MKKISLFAFLTFSLLNAQTVEFPSLWKFKTGDDVRYKETSFDDSQWNNIAVPSQWETQGFPNYDGYAWYRTKFSVPKNLLNKELFLLLGKVDDIDETFLNGKKIGGLGKFPPVNESAWNQQRIYKIPAGVLKEQNILTVRVFDGGAPGGVIGGLIGLYTKKEYEKELNLGPPPKKSYSKLTTSNGLIAAVYDEKTNRIETAMPHIFQAFDSSHSVRAFARDIRPIISKKPKSVSYEGNTHVICTDYDNFSIYYFAPFTTEEKILYAVIRGFKDDIENIQFEYHSGAGTILKREALRAIGKTAEKYFLFSFKDSLHNNSAAIENAAIRVLTSPSSLLVSEVKFMKNVFASANMQKNISKKEKNVIEQSIAVLKMAQVGEKEIFPLSRGQILASLPPGVWNIAWVRDGSYSIMALARLGLFSEAKRALQFMLSAESNNYKKFIHNDGKDYGIGKDYQISVCRYFGNGKEESDFNDDGPNIEIDGFGLFLTAFSEYVKESRDTNFFKENYSVLTEKIADVILHSIAENNLIRNESGPWERHLPGAQYAYTSAVCAAGLQIFAEVSRSLNLPFEKYFSGADRLQKGIMENLLSKTGVVAGRATIPLTHFEYFDAATFELFASGIINDSKLFSSHIKAYEKVLRIPGKKRGYVRTTSTDWYESQEWIFLNTRLASAYARFGKKKEAKLLLDWITAQAQYNFNLIPELFTAKEGNYEGAIPMVGFGAGTYILGLIDYYEHK